MMNSHIRLILAFGFVYCCLVGYARLTCWRDPTSMFYDDDRAHVPNYSRRRIQESLDYADRVGAEQPDKPITIDPPELCVGIASVNREGISYLKSTLGSLQQGLSLQERSRVHFVVLIAHINQTLHSDYNKPWLRAMVDSLVSYSDDEEWMALAAEMVNETHGTKSKFDYSVVMEQCLKTGAPYTLMVEDDVVFLDGWRHRLMEALETATTKTWASARKEFLYIRVFYFEKIRGWDSDYWPKYLFWSIVTASSVAGALIATRQHALSTRRHLTRPVFFLVVFVFTPLLIGLYFAAGANSVQPQARGVHLMPDHACCGQSLAFPRGIIEDGLLPYFKNNRWSKVPTDSFIEKFGRTIDGLTWALHPVLAQHVGGKSSYGAGRGHYGVMTPGAIWNFQFETNDADRLAMEHAKVVQAELMGL